VGNDATDGAAQSFMIKCAHPSRFDQALPEGDARNRIHALRADASKRSHEELDEAERLDAGDPADLPRRYVELRRDLPGLHAVGGCRGTNLRQVTAISDSWLDAS
jgi:S-methylmethionine-dependent homocysteine/selenocysteine methylase